MTTWVQQLFHNTNFRQEVRPWNRVCVLLLCHEYSSCRHQRFKWLRHQRHYNCHIFMRQLNVGWRRTRHMSDDTRRAFSRRQSPLPRSARAAPTQRRIKLGTSICCPHTAQCSGVWRPPTVGIDICAVGDAGRQWSSRSTHRRKQWVVTTWSRVSCATFRR